MRGVDDFMIDYLMTIYRTYDLLDIQIENFEKKFSESEYRLIVVDNTPNSEKKEIKNKDKIDLIVDLDSSVTFDGVSHGGALDVGLNYCESPIVCILDSDFFFLKNVTDYVKEKFSLGYEAVGSSWDDGLGTRPWVKRFPDRFNNIPCAFGAFYNLELAKSNSWIVTREDVANGQSTGFIETGWRIRKHILDNSIKTFSWKTKSNGYGNCFFEDENQNMVGMHYVGGSHVRWNENTQSEIKSIIGSY